MNSILTTSFRFQRAAHRSRLTTCSCFAPGTILKRRTRLSDCQLCTVPFGQEALGTQHGILTTGGDWATSSPTLLFSGAGTLGAVPWDAVDPLHSRATVAHVRRAVIN